MEINLDDVFDLLEDSHRYTSGIWALCPFHDDHSPSFHVSENGYKCQSASCGAKGSLRSLYIYLTGRNVPKVIKSNPNVHSYIWKRWEEKFGTLQNVARIAHQQIIERPELANYLEKRKIDSQIKKGMLGYLEGYYTFPVRNEFLEIAGVQLRASPTIQNERNRYLNSPKCPTPIYVPDWIAILKSEQIYVVFGTIDAWSMTMAGYPTLSGSGQGLSAEHLTQRKLHFGIADFGEEKSMLKLSSHMGWRMQALKINWPDGCKDINDIHVKYGLEKVKEIIETSKENYG